MQWPEKPVAAAEDHQILTPATCLDIKLDEEADGDEISSQVTDSHSVDVESLRRKSVESPAR